MFHNKSGGNLREMAAIYVSKQITIYHDLNCTVGFIGWFVHKYRFLISILYCEDRNHRLYKDNSVDRGYVY